jgi:hypothetical protein
MTAADWCQRQKSERRAFFCQIPGYGKQCSPIWSKWEETGVKEGWQWNTPIPTIWKKGLMGLFGSMVVTEQCPEEVVASVRQCDVSGSSIQVCLFAIFPTESLSSLSTHMLWRTPPAVTVSHRTIIHTIPKCIHVQGDLPFSVIQMCM